MYDILVYTWTIDRERVSNIHYLNIMSKITAMNALFSCNGKHKLHNSMKSWGIRKKIRINVNNYSFIYNMNLYSANYSAG